MKSRIEDLELIISNAKDCKVINSAKYRRMLYFKMELKVIDVCISRNFPYEKGNYNFIEFMAININDSQYDFKAMLNNIYDDNF